MSFFKNYFRVFHFIKMRINVFCNLEILKCENWKASTQNWLINNWKKFKDFTETITADFGFIRFWSLNYRCFHCQQKITLKIISSILQTVSQTMTFSHCHQFCFHVCAKSRCNSQRKHFVFHQNRLSEENFTCAKASLCKAQ